MRRDPLGVLAVGVEQPGGVEMAAGALEQRDILLDRVLDERVHEPQRLAGEHDLDAGQRVRRGRGGVDREPRQRGCAPQRNVVTEDRDRARERRRRRAEPPDPDAQRADHGIGGERAGAARQRGPAQALLVGQRHQELVNVERVAVRDLDAGLDHGGIGTLAERSAGQLLHGLEAEPRQALEPHLGMTGDAVERLGGLAADRWAAGHHERDRQLVEPVQDIEDELERGDVAPVEVVDREHRRPRLSRARHHREQPVGHREIAGVVRVEHVLARAGK